MALDVEELALGRRRRPPRLLVVAVIAGIVAAAATTIVVLGRTHHRSHVSTPPSGPAPLVCGREIDRPPNSGRGPIDGGLVITLARITPVTQPQFESVTATRRWLPGDAPVVVVRVGRDVRIYPFAILEWHEVVDDVVGGRPVAITYCPLCNTTLVYSRSVAGKTVQLRSSGALLLGSAVLVDPATRNLWSQVTGQPYSNYGRIAGAPLTWLPSDILSLDTASAAYPGARVLARPSGTGIDYTASPYGLVASRNSLPQLYVGWVDQRLTPKSRLVGVAANGVAEAFRYDALRHDIVHNDTIGGVPVVVVYRAHVSGIGDSADLRRTPQTGVAVVFHARVGGRVLHFSAAAPGVLRDRETGTTWDLTGRALAGPLSGMRLTTVRFIDTYWFAWLAFYPDTKVWPSLRPSQCSVGS